jgi:hypothetical protein
MKQNLGATDSPSLVIEEIYVQVDGADVVLLIPAEKLGVLLTLPVANALGRSLIAAAQETTR